MTEEEATEKGVISVTPSSDKPKGAARRNSTGKASTTDPSSLSNSNEKPLPHYLRASTGSCHDFCKYGRKHVFETKKRRPVRPIFLGNNEALNEEDNQVKPPDLRHRRKRLELKLKKPKPEFSDELNISKQKVPSEELLSIESGEQARFDCEEVSSDEPVVIKLMTSSPNDPSNEHAQANREGSEEQIETNLECSSPSEMSIASDDPTLATWVEGAPEEPSSTKLMTPCIEKSMLSAEHSCEGFKSAEHISGNQADGPSKKLTRSKLKTAPSNSESNGFIENVSVDRSKGSSGVSRTKKAKNSSPVCNSIVPSKQTPAHLTKRPSSKPINVKLKTPVLQKSIASAERTPVNRSKESVDERTQMKSSGVGNGKGHVTEPKATRRSVTELSVKPKVIKQKEIDVSGKPSNIKHKTPSPVKKRTTSIDKKLVEGTSSSASATPKTIKHKISSPSKRFSISAKPSGARISLKTFPSISLKAFPSISSGAQSALRKQDNRITKGIVRSEIGEKVVLKPVRASPSSNTPVNGISSIVMLKKYRNTKSASPVKYKSKFGKGDQDTEVVKEKILHVIEPKQEKKYLKPINQKYGKFRSSLTSVSSSSYKHDESDSAFSEASVSNVKKGRKTSKNPADAWKGGKKRTTTVRPEDKPPSPHKLKFRRGKIVSFQPENNAPRRLKFRPARVPSENQNGKGDTGKSFSRREVNIAIESMNPPSLEAPIIVLRHQDVQDKKDTQGLLNHVIEETASKLVESRKSKVMALVGAFETVISLQENKYLTLG